MKGIKPNRVKDFVVCVVIQSSPIWVYLFSCFSPFKNLVLLKVIFYFHPYLGAFWGLFFIFVRFLKQIQEKESWQVIHPMGSMHALLQMSMSKLPNCLHIFACFCLHVVSRFTQNTTTQLLIPMFLNISIFKTPPGYFVAHVCLVRRLKEKNSSKKPRKTLIFLVI